MTRPKAPKGPALPKLPEEVWKSALVGDVSAVQKYLTERGDLEARDPHGRTLLMNASNRGFAELVRLLLEAGADLNTQDPAGWTALHFAPQGFFAEICRMLIDKGKLLLPTARRPSGLVLTSPGLGPF